MQKYTYIAFLCLLLTSCGTYFNQPFEQQEARTGEVTPKTDVLREFPLPADQVVVGVYNFRDQTGQYKSVDNGSTFSTAVSQGATTMLIKALEDSKWFAPIERENLNNLYTERSIISNARKEFEQREKKPQPPLTPLLFADVLLEGGVVSYDSNIVTGGIGARYFGVGGSTQYREDRLTIYLRAVSTSNGKILKTVYVSKTVLSQAIDASLFRYVNFQRLLEVETGITKNEPIQLAMKDAIEKAVEALIIEGIQINLWRTKDGPEVDRRLVETYMKEKEAEENTLLYDRQQTPFDFNNTMTLSGFTNIFNSDFARKPLNYGASLGYTRRITDKFGATLRGSYMNLEGGRNFDEDFIAVDGTVEAYLLPYDDITPYVYAGGGVIFHLDETGNNSAQIETQGLALAGVGVDIKLSQRMGLRAFAEADYMFKDNLDRATAGQRNDIIYKFGLGINYSFGKIRNILSQRIEQIQPSNRN